MTILNDPLSEFAARAASAARDNNDHAHSLRAQLGTITDDIVRACQERRCSLGEIRARRDATLSSLTERLRELPSLLSTIETLYLPLHLALKDAKRTTGNLRNILKAGEEGETIWFKKENPLEKILGTQLGPLPSSAEVAVMEACRSLGQLMAKGREREDFGCALATHCEACMTEAAMLLSFQEATVRLALSGQRDTPRPQDDGQQSLPYRR